MLFDLSVAEKGVAACPVCSRRSLYAHQDTKFGGVWGYCRRCGARGDLVELASLAWKTSLQASAEELAAAGEDVDASASAVAKLQKRIAQRQAIEDYMRDCSAMWEHATGAAAKLKQRLCWQSSGTPFWRKLIAPYAGVTTARMAGKAFHKRASSLFPMQQIRAGESAAMVLALSDMPGRICGVCLLSLREDDAITQQVLGESGLFLLESAPTAGDPFIVMTDIEDCLRTQSHRARELDTLRPAVGVPLQPPAPYVWSALPGPLVFSGEKRPELLAMAAASGGDIADVCSRKQLWTSWASGRERWSRKAARWAMNAANPDEARRFLAAAGLQPQHVGEVIAAAKADGAYVQSLFAESGALRVALGRRVVVERDAKWWCGSTGELVCDASLRIARTVMLRSSGQACYEGEIVFHGKRYPFQAPCETVDSGAFAWMRRFLLEAGAGDLSFNSGFSSRAAEIARRLRPPASAVVSGGCGWDAARREFVFPAFALGAQGVCAKQQAVSDYGPVLGLPQPLTPEHLLLALRPSPENVLFWAGAAAIGAAVCGPALMWPPRSVGSTTAAALAAPAAVWGLRKAAGEESRIPQMAAHLTPVALLSAASGKRRRFLEAWRSGYNPPLVLAMSPAATACAPLHCPWLFVEGTAAAPAPAFLQAASAALWEWLADLRRRGLRTYGAPEKTDADAVLADMAGWAVARGGAPGVFDLALQHVQPSPRPHEQLVALAVRLLERGELSLRREGETVGLGAIVTGRKRVRVPCAPICRRMRLCGWPLATDSISLCVEDAGVGVSDDAGWLFHKEFWDETTTAIVAKAKSLRVVG